ncbi:dual specificity protein kinase TTK-like [Macrobrachium nipponense]|uniref:dual specificity protein kinase TTK-like n=1 Tax=Macrobrachium nipponense TaxID=159736 RepID=UPI0030C7D044
MSIDSENIMEEDDSEWDTGPTIEEIISSAAKRKSKLGLSGGPLFLRKATSQSRASSSPEGEQVTQSKTTDLRTYTSASKVLEKESLKTVNDAGISNNSEGLHPENCPKNNANWSAKKQGDRYGSNMQRSVSTPDLKSRYLIKVSTNTTVGNGLEKYSSISSSSESLKQVRSGQEDKENKKTNVISLSPVSENDKKNTLKLTSKPPWKEESSVNKIEIKKCNTKTDQQHINCLMKRELSISSVDAGNEIRPPKIANIRSSPLTMQNNLSGVFSNSQQTAESDVKRIVSAGQQIMKASSNTPIGEHHTKRSSSTSGTKLTSLNIGESSKGQYLGGSHVQNSDIAQENSASSRQATDCGYSSGNFNNNSTQSTGHSLGGKSLNLKPPRNALPLRSPASNPKFDHLEVNGREFLKLKLLGRGGSSKVYEVLDLETRETKAIKVVELEGLDEPTLKCYENEIAILKRLQWSDRVIKLYDFEVTATHLKLLMEKGNQDMASVLSEVRGSQRARISPFTVKHYWQGMLLAVQAIHNEGIIHSDLKPANFVLVNQTVKLIDFGISSSIQQDMTSIVKDSPGGTYNYMSPESTMDAHSGLAFFNNAGNKLTVKIGVKSDVWSLGCILYNLVYGKTPFQHIVNPLQKLTAISDPKTKITFDGIEDKELQDVMQLCLQYDPRKRPSIQQLLNHPYLTSGSHSGSSTPRKDSQIKSAVDQLAKLTPNSLQKITSMMQKMRPNQ